MVLDAASRNSYRIGMTGYTATVSEKGQVTIPKALRDRLGIRPGQRLEAHDEGGRIVLEKIDETDSIDRAYGSVKTGVTTDEFLREIRGDYYPD